MQERFRINQSYRQRWIFQSYFSQKKRYRSALCNENYEEK